MSLHGKRGKAACFAPLPALALHFDVGGKDQIEMEGAGSGSGPLDMVSRGSGTETRPHSARLYGRTGTTGFYNFRSCGQSFPLEKSDFF